MFDVAICDELIFDRQNLREIICKNDFKKNIRVHEFASGVSLIKSMQEIKLSLLFLNICMKGANGEEIAKEVRQLSNDIILVYYSEFDPTPSCIEMQPFRYIKKNMNELDIERYVSDSLQEMTKNNKNLVLTAKSNKKILFLRPYEIICIEKYKKSTRVYISKAAQKAHGVENGKEHSTDIRISNKLIKLYEMLKPYGFGYPHDSYIINFAYMASYSCSAIKMDELPNAIFKLSRSKSQEFLCLRKHFMLSMCEDLQTDLSVDENKELPNDASE